MLDAERKVVPVGTCSVITTLSAVVLPALWYPSAYSRMVPTVADVTPSSLVIDMSTPLTVTEELLVAE